MKFSIPTLAIVCCIGCGDASFQIEIPKSRLQSIEEWFPVSTADSDEQLPVDAVLDNPKILLEPGSDKVGFRLSIHVTASNGPVPLPQSKPAVLVTPIGPGGPPFPGHPGLNQQPPEKKDNAPPSSIDGIAIVHGAIRYEPTDGKIYIDNATVTKLSFDNLPPELEQPVNRTIETVMKKYLAENAVYQLDEKDISSKLAKSVLKSIKISDGALLIEVGM